jgi:single-strand DNA-binding protein
MQMNRIEIAGYTSAEPSMRYLTSGTRVVNLRLGESRRYAGPDNQQVTQNNQQVTQTNWHNLTFYNALAEQAMSYKTGINLFVEGSVQQRKFKPKDGSERTVHEVIVQSCHVIADPAQRPGGVDTRDSHKEVEDQAVDAGNGDDWPL